MASPARSQPTFRQYLLASAVLLAGLGPAVALFFVSSVIFKVALGVAALTCVVYVLGSAMSARPLRKVCPVCGADGLEKLDPAREIGVCCGACGYIGEQEEPDYYSEFHRDRRDRLAGPSEMGNKT